MNTDTSPDENAPSTGAQSSRPPSERFEIPSILLEGDEPSAALAAGPGQKFELGLKSKAEPSQPRPPSEWESEKCEAAPLVESYETQELLLTASDPHCLYAHWDLSAEQQRDYTEIAGGHRLILRVHSGSTASDPLHEIQPASNSRHSFVNVEKAGAQYVVQLGYYRSNGQWAAISTSGPAITAPDEQSVNKTVQFVAMDDAEVNLDAEVPGDSEEQEKIAVEASATERPLEAPRVAWIPALEPGAAYPGEYELPISEQIGQPVSEVTRAEPPARVPAHLSEWTPAREIALAKLLPIKHHAQADSLAIEELIGSQRAAASSPSGQPPVEPRNFWLTVNAELIIYGATEPTASLAIGGQPLATNPDGSFSYRLALPNGTHALRVEAVSAEGESRGTELEVSRRTA